MRRIFTMIAALAVALMPTSAQYKMQVELNNGYVTDFYVSEIKQIIWSYDNPGQGGGEEDEPTVTGDATDITNYTATITAWANNIRDNLSQDLKVGIIYTAEGTPSKNNGTKKTVSKSYIADDGKYSVELTGLSPSTTYYYRSYVYQSGLWFYGKVKSFTTESDVIYDKQPTIIDELIFYEEGVSNFVEVLKTTNVMVGEKLSEKTYAELLADNQFFTLWVPLNSSLDQGEWDRYMKSNKTYAENLETAHKFLNNHMSRTKYSNDGQTKSVITLNNKHYTMDGNGIDGIHFQKSNIMCANGVMHILTGKLNYHPNLYEYLTSDGSPYADNLGAFLKKYTKKELNKEKSISAGYYNEKAELVYADSVMELESPIFEEFGFFNEEDSTYNLVLPVWHNWMSALDTASIYFHYGMEAGQYADSLSEYKSNCALLTDAVFNMNSKMQPYYNAASGMKMVSTKYNLTEDPVKQVQYHTYVDPFKGGKFQGKYEFLDVIPCSNGNIYIYM